MNVFAHMDGFAHPVQQPAESEIRIALERMAASAAFAASPRLRAFLRYIVEQALAGKAARIKGYTIAVEALGRSADFDPRVDPIVRVEAGRLRRRLERYYASEGAGEPVVIDLPRGHYVPKFVLREVTEKDASPPGSNGHGRHGPNGHVAAMCASATTPLHHGGGDMLAMVRQLIDLQQIATVHALTALDELSARVLSCRDLKSAFETILDAAIRLQAADFGNVQLFDERTRALSIVAQRGFDENFVAVFRSVSADSTCACGRALRTGAPVVIEDVQEDVQFAPYRGEAVRAGFRAVQSTPLVASTGKLIGMLSTHFRMPHLPSKFEMLLTGIYGRLAADVLVRFRADTALAAAGGAPGLLGASRRGDRGT